MYTISKYFRKAACELSGKECECVAVTAADGSLSNAVLSLTALGQLLRLHAKQHEKSNGTTAAKSAKSSSTDAE